MTETFKDQAGTEWTVHRTSNHLISIEHPRYPTRFVGISRGSNGVSEITASGAPPEVAEYLIGLWLAEELPVRGEVAEVPQLKRAERIRAAALEIIAARDQGTREDLDEAIENLKRSLWAPEKVAEVQRG